MKKYYAHIVGKDLDKGQTVQEHNEGTAILASMFTNVIGLSKIGYLSGLYHDVGKLSEIFQRYILSANGFIKPNESEWVNYIAEKGKIIHSGAGAQFIHNYLYNNTNEENRVVAQMLSLCILGHHSGLKDCITPDGINKYKQYMEKGEEKTYIQEVTKKIYETYNPSQDFNGIVKLFSTKIKEIMDTAGNKENKQLYITLLIRFLFSCLIDADRIDTARYYEKMAGTKKIRNDGKYIPWEILLNRFNKKTFSTKNNIDEMRNEVRNACRNASKLNNGIYSLTAPTGSGKTLSSLLFALLHCIEHGMERIIYVAPYTTIIDQNSETYREILEMKNEVNKVVLEHHCNIEPEDKGEDEKRYRVSIENWDVPIVTTTIEKLMDAMYGPGTNNARRMHRLANSVIIFDEIQTLPPKCFRLFNESVKFLTQNCKSTVLLCTATQPVLDKIESVAERIRIKEIIPNPTELFNKSKRVEIIDKTQNGGWKIDKIRDFVFEQQKHYGDILVVVNTKKQAFQLYTKCKETIEQEGIKVKLFHLSTLMCPAHRMTKINGKQLYFIDESANKMVRENTHSQSLIPSLSRDEPVICISTQLIEAGIDIDFKCAIRYLAGFDSIAQTAGRVNRNGLYEMGMVFVINPKDSQLERLAYIREGANISQEILNEFKENPESFDNYLLSPNTMKTYFFRLYNKIDNKNDKYMDYIIKEIDDTIKNLLSWNTKSYMKNYKANGYCCSMPIRQAFETGFKNFRIIDNITTPVLVPYNGEALTLIENLKSGIVNYSLEKQYKILERAPRFSVSVFPYHLKLLQKLGAIAETQPESGVWYLKKEYYSLEYGIDIFNIKNEDNTNYYADF